MYISTPLRISPGDTPGVLLSQDHEVFARHTKFGTFQVPKSFLNNTKKSAADAAAMAAKQAAKLRARQAAKQAAKKAKKAAKQAESWQQKKEAVKTAKQAKTGDAVPFEAKHAVGSAQVEAAV